MIQYVKRENIDIIKYDACIANSVQSRIYAFSWYLDIVADNWDVLVLNDYEAVMPLPWKQKYFIKYVTQPFFCQQLGVFSKEFISEDEQEIMLKNIPKKFIKISLNLNSGTFFSSRMKSRINYILTIENSFQENYKRISKNRKRDFKKAQAFSLTLEKNLQLDDFYTFYLSNDKNYSKHTSIKRVLKSILKLKKGVIKCYGVKSKSDLVATVLLLDDGKRLTYLVPVTNDFGKEKGASTMLVLEIIKQYQNKNYTLDFEGSMISNVAKFYNSFGAEKEMYSVLLK